MKKFVVTLMAVLVFALSNGAVQAHAAEQTNKVNVIIDYVYFDKQAKAYFGVSEEDADGGKWVVSIIEYNKDVKELTKVLNKLYKGLSVNIEYIGSLDNDSIEIVDQSIVGGNK
ncbi:hypothetical protein M5X17_31345 [Paenibacillus alvei]|uniref:hypothetical protein n=1 Tax=Paenibacillus alvei TaxID=44250 RepID=UPI0022810525|nr:hypothetical protein [Paenibacillus alvei]MCY9738190.1 hypothetical protein [Paenibacillus alvei]